MSSSSSSSSSSFCSAPEQSLPYAQYRESMEWFQSFYTTKATDDYEKALRAHKKQVAAKKYQGKREAHSDGEVSGDGDVDGKADRENSDRDCESDDKCDSDSNSDDEEEDDEGPKLTWSASSFAYGSLYQYCGDPQVDKFDRTTLYRIVVMHATEVGPEHAKLLTRPLSALVSAVFAIIGQELSTDTMDVTGHPVMQLMSGILCNMNWKWLSDADWTKWLNANGIHRSPTRDSNDYDTELLLSKQIELLQELVDKERIGSMHGYNNILGVLQNNKEYLELPTDWRDEPDAYIRNKQRLEQEAKNGAGDDDDDDSNAME